MFFKQLLISQQLTAQDTRLLFLFVDLFAARQKTGFLLLPAAAGQRTAGIDDISRQSNDSGTKAAFFGGCQSGIHIVRYQHPTQQKFKDRRQFYIIADQIGSKSPNTRQFCQCLFFTAAFIIFDSIKRQEGRPAGLTLFKIGDSLFGGFRTAHNKVLRRSS